MTDEMRLRMLEGARTLYHKSFEIIGDFDLEVQTLGAARLLEHAAIRDDCECKPGLPVCPACCELARVLYGDEIPF
jgi:hypothetical protein